MENAIVKIVSSITEAGPKTIDAISRAFPGIAERSKVNAASYAVRTMADDINAMIRIANETGMSQEMAVSLVNAAYERHGSDLRIAECLAFGIPKIEENDDSYGVDDEWLDYWRVHASKARAEDVQAIWGAVWAGEVNKPGTFSKKSMNILGEMSREDARLFERLCSVCTGGRCEFTEEDFEIIPYKTREGLFGGSDLTNDDMIQLSSLGLVENNFFKGGSVTADKGYKLVINGELFVVKAVDKPDSLIRGNCLLTTSGQELAVLCDIGSHPGFLEFVRSDVEKQGFELEMTERIIRNAGYATMKDVPTGAKNDQLKES